MHQGRLLRERLKLSVLQYAYQGVVMFRKSMIATAAACAVGIGSVALAMGSIPKQQAAPPPPAAGTNTNFIAECLDGGSPITMLESRARAEKVLRACAGAIQSHKLTPTELAQARLNRGAARATLGDHILASGDYLEALRHYESSIDPDESGLPAAVS